MNISIVIADDHPLMLRGLTDFLISKNFNIKGSAQDGNAAYSLIVKHQPDIAILDIRMPYKTGIEIADACKKNNLKTKIILITFDKEEELFDKAKELGIYGYILKDFAIEEIENCINHVIQNKPYFSQELIMHLTTNVISCKPDYLDALTRTELKILKLISENKISQEISDELSISIKTVHKHRSNIIAKLKVDNKPSTLSIWATLNKHLL